MSGDEGLHGREPPYAPNYGQIDTKQSYATNYGAEQTTSFPPKQAYALQSYPTQEGYRPPQEVLQGGYTQDPGCSPYQTQLPPEQQHQAYAVQSQYGGYGASQGYPQDPQRVRDEACYSPYNTNVDARYINSAPEQVMVRTGQAAERPDNFLCLALFVTIFCCLPFGICGIIHASQVKGLWRDGEFEEARTASRLAKKWSIAGIVFALLVEITSGVVMVLKNWNMISL